MAGTMLGPDITLFWRIRGYNMKKFFRIISFFIVVILINNIAIFIYGFSTIKTSKTSLEGGSFSDILIGENTNIDYNDYFVQNWTEGGIAKENSKEILQIISDIRCEKLNKFYCCLVCWAQTSYNSISEIELQSISGKDIEYPINKDTLTKLTGSVFCCDIVKIFNQYYIITRSIDGTGIDDAFTKSVYKMDTDESVGRIELYKTQNELYKRSFPGELYHYYSSPVLIILSFIVMFFEAFIVFLIYKKIIRNNQGTVL